MSKLGKNALKEFSGFYIHSFMLELGLSGSVLLVYAMVYSFSTRGIGLCFTDRQFVADRLGISVRSVGRAFETLFEKGLIKRVRIGDYYGYTVTSEAAKRDPEIYLPEKKEEAQSTPDTDVRCEPLPAENTAKTVKKRDTYQKTDENDEPPERRYPYHRLGENDEIPKHLFRFYGRKGYIRMTPEQYADLVRLVEPDVLSFYLGRLEEICQKCYDELTRVPKSHYKLLRKWIDEDTHVKGSSSRKRG